MAAPGQRHGRPVRSATLIFPPAALRLLAMNRGAVIPCWGIVISIWTSAVEPGGWGARIQPEQGGLPQAAAPDRRPGARPAADGRGGQVLHRHLDSGLGRD